MYRRFGLLAIGLVEVVYGLILDTMSTNRGESIIQYVARHGPIFVISSAVYDCDSVYGIGAGYRQFTLSANTSHRRLRVGSNLLCYDGMDYADAKSSLLSTFMGCLRSCIYDVLRGCIYRYTENS